MTLGFALPIGHPAQSLAEPTRRARLTQLAALLQRDATSFSGDDVLAVYRLGAGAPTWASEVFAPWGGALARQPDALLTVELPPLDARALGAVLPARGPVPRRVTFGPVALAAGIDPGTGSRRVEAGDRLGTLSGDQVRLGFEDQGGYWIDPAWCVAALDAAGLWSLPAGSANPLAVAGASAAARPIAVAGPRIPPQRGRPMLALSGGQVPVRVFNPPEGGVAAHVLSLLSSDTVTVGVFNLPARHTIALRVDDRTDGAARSPALQFLAPRTTDASVEFRPDRDLRPGHPAYQPGAGSEAVPPPLRYGVRIDVQSPAGALVSTLATRIEQRPEDVLRQAYVFHSPPYQSSAALEVPSANGVRAVRPADDRIALPEIYRGPYLARGIAVDPGALLAGAEMIRRGYFRRLFEDGTLTAAQREHLSADLTVVRGWLDPETNEHLGGPIDEPAQWAGVLDVAPFHTHLGGTLFLALARSAADFLGELRRANPGQAFAETTVRLRKGGDELWRWTVSATGVTEAEGARFGSVVGGTPSAEAAAAAAGAAALAATPPPSPTPEAAVAAETTAARAAVVSITFTPRPLTAALASPPVAAYPPEPAPPAQRVSLIVLGTEHTSAPQETRIPIDLAGAAIEGHLRQRFPGDQVVTREIGDPISLLQELGAFSGAAPARFRFVFLLSHAFHHGLQLMHGSGLPPVHDPDVDRALREVYGRRYAIGGNDLREFKTHQFRVSNLTRLPAEMAARLRRSVSGAEGIFVLGCQSGEHATGISHALAQALGIPVWGANDSAKFYFHAGGQQWSVLPPGVTRGSHGLLSGSTVVLLNAERGGERIKMIAESPDDLLAVYRQQLRRFDPGSPEPAP